MKISCVIVTYSDRFHLISKVLTALINQPIHEVIIVDNGSEIKSKIQLKAFLKEYKIPNKIIELPFNQGSASGFKTGIIHATQSSNDFIWLLDDDNLPLNNSLQMLIDFWEKSTINNKEEKLALLSNRIDRVEFINALNKQDEYAVLPPINSFLGFNLKTFGSKIAERFSSKTIKETEIPYGKVIVGPYGGLFFNKKIVSTGLLPDEKYFLYLDDFDFTYRFTKNGGEIWFIKDSRIKDIELSDYIKKKKGILYHSIFDAKHDFVTYYACRNLCYFQNKYYIKNKFFFNLNKIFFILYIFILGTIRLNYKRINILLEALSDSKNNKMGKNPKHNI